MALGVGGRSDPGEVVEVVEEVEAGAVPQVGQLPMGLWKARARAQSL